METSNKPTQTEILVHSNNELRKAAKLAINQILPQLPQYLNKKIRTNDGWSKKFTYQLEEFKPTPINNDHVSFSSWLNVRFSGYISITVKLCFNGGSYEAKPYSTAYCQYIDRTIDLGKINTDGVLIEVEDLDKIITDYHLNRIDTVEEQIETSKKIEQLESELRTLKYKMLER